MTKEVASTPILGKTNARSSEDRQESSEKLQNLVGYCIISEFKLPRKPQYVSSMSVQRILSSRGHFLIADSLVSSAPSSPVLVLQHRAPLPKGKGFDLGHNPL